MLQYYAKSLAYESGGGLPTPIPADAKMGQ